MAKSRRVPDDTDDDPRPRKKSRPRDEDEEDDQPMRPRKKKKSAAGPMKKAMMIGGSILGFIGLIFLLYWIYSPVGIDSSMLCYCPPETISLEGMDIEELSKVTEAKEMTDSIVNGWKTQNDKRLTPGGIKETDVAKILIAHVNGSGDTSVEPQQRRGVLTVLRLKNPIEEEKFVAGYANGAYRVDELTGHEGKKYYQLYQNLAGGRQDDVSFFIPNSRTLVMATTRREIEEALKRRSGKVELEGDMLDLANKVDGHFFSAFVAPTSTRTDGGRFAFNLSVTSDAEVKPPAQAPGAYWYASDGNYMLYGEALLMPDRAAASELRSSIGSGFARARSQVIREDSKLSGIEEVFFPKSPTGQSMGGGGSKADTIEGLVDYVRHSRVYRRDRLVVVEGKINIEAFTKMWSGIGSKFMPSRGMNRGW